MKVVLITDDFFPKLGGVSQMLTNFCKFFKLEPHTLFVFNPYYKSKNIFNLLKTKNYSLRDIGEFFFKRRNIFLTFYSFLKIIQDKKTPFIHRVKIILYFFTKIKVLMKVVANINLLYPHLTKLDFDLILGGNSGWILSLNYVLSKIMNKKLVSIAHGNDFIIRNPFSLRTYFFRNTDKIIVTNNVIKYKIKKMHNLDNSTLEVIHLGIDSKALELEDSKLKLRKEFNIPEDKFILLSVGRHVARKKFELVIKAINEIKKLKKTLNLKYYLIGEGEETENLKKITNDLKLSEFIEFLGSCDSEIRNKFYKLSDLFVMPSITDKAHIEGFGIVFLEANYFNIPVIGTRTGGMVEAIKDGETGFLIKPNDIAELGKKILLLYEDKDLRKKMGENGHQRVVDEFQWNKIVLDYCRLFENLKDNGI